MVKMKRMTAAGLAALMLVAGVGTPTASQAAGIKLSKTSATLTVGKSITLKVTGTKEKVTWSTTKKEVATVTQKGKVTGKSAGKATIKAKVAKKTLKCSVTVKAKAVTPLSINWTADSAAAERLRNYVKKVTNTADSANYIPECDRIAVFDMDGTLCCETFFTYYDTMMFIQFLKDHPEKATDELKAAAAALKPKYKAGIDLAMNFAKAYAGMTVEELYQYAVEFGKRYTDSFVNMRYIDGFYLPMVELVKYLYDNGFTIYVISGTERTTTRAIIDNSPIADYVSSAHIIGTEFEVKVKGSEDKPYNIDVKYEPGNDLVFSGGFIQKNLNSNKSIEIEREIGQRPVLAFGNSGSDTSMMDYVIDSRNPYPTDAFMLIDDDTDREWANENWEELSAKYSAMNYQPVSFKNDFKNIYAEGITKAAEQAPGLQPAA